MALTEWVIRQACSVLVKNPKCFVLIVCRQEAEHGFEVHLGHLELPLDGV